MKRSYKLKYLKLLVLSMLLASTSVYAGLNDGLVGDYPFDSNANDASGNGNHGVVHGATLTEDRFGNTNSAYSFDGINDYISVDDGSQFNFASDLTVSLWVNPGLSHSSLPYAGLIDKSHSHNSNGGIVKSWVIQQVSDSTNDFSFGFSTNNTTYSFPSTSVLLKPNVWSHVLVSKENKTVKYYKDGTLVSTHNVSVSSIDTNGSLPLIIGSVNNLNRFFNGKIDDIRVYNRALSSEEVTTLYSGVINDENCKHAVYSPKRKTLTIPFIEMPVIDFLTGQPTGDIELWQGKLKQVLGTVNRFRVLSPTITQITDGSTSSCPATYTVETGTLTIPYIDVPTGIEIGNQQQQSQNVEVFKSIMTWDQIGNSFVVREIEQVAD